MEMENEIYEYLSKYIPITEELEDELSKIEFIKRLASGTILLEEGKISNIETTSTSWACTKQHKNDTDL